jgi:ribulose-5-phosphate 4-epimerase/fuculose-1-phosphate aldolase
MRWQTWSTAAPIGWPRLRGRLVFTHISRRAGRRQHFLINPYGFMFEEITA